MPHLRALPKLCKVSLTSLALRNQCGDSERGWGGNPVAIGRPGRSAEGRIAAHGCRPSPPRPRRPSGVAASELGAPGLVPSLPCVRACAYLCVCIPVCTCTLVCKCVHTEVCTCTCECKCVCTCGAEVTLHILHRGCNILTSCMFLKNTALARGSGCDPLQQPPLAWGQHSLRFHTL